MNNIVIYPNIDSAKNSIYGNLCTNKKLKWSTLINKFIKWYYNLIKNNNNIKMITCDLLTLPLYEEDYIIYIIENIYALYDHFKKIHNTRLIGYNKPSFKIIFSNNTFNIISEKLRDCYLGFEIDTLCSKYDIFFLHSDLDVAFIIYYNCYHIFPDGSVINFKGERKTI